MLSDRERRTLDETERELVEDDPRLGARLAGHRLPVMAWARVCAVCVVGWAVAVMVGLMWLGLVGEALLFAVTVALLLGFGVRPGRLGFHRPPVGAGPVTARTGRSPGWAAPTTPVAEPPRRGAACAHPETEDRSSPTWAGCAPETGW